MSCPLCDAEGARPSWLGSTFYRGREFPYVECLACGSLYCEPMPDDETLAVMYGPEYGKSFADDPALSDPKEPRKVVELLDKLGAGTFLDYGCGGGVLLEEAAKKSWRAVGVEFEEKVARETARRTGLEVLTAAEAGAGRAPLADVLHLGDVIEHLTRMNEQMPGVLRLLKPGGLLVAQGPLEGNANLFTLGLRLARSLRRGERRTEMPPYHVMLATARGQSELFRRFGLDEVSFDVQEVAWPAPARLARADLSSPRALGLYTLRRLSQAATALGGSGRRWGNRYFYVGRRSV